MKVRQEYKTGRKKLTAEQFRASERWAKAGSMAGLQGYIVKEYLAMYPKILEEYLLESTSVEFIENTLEKIRAKPKCSGKLLIQQQSVARTAPSTSRYSTLGTAAFCDRVQKCETDTDICAEINEMCHVIGGSINAEAFSIYLIGDNDQDMLLYKPGEDAQYLGPVGRNMTVSAHVAIEKTSLNIIDLQQDSRFPKGIGIGDDTTHQVICIPVLKSDGRCFGVVEFTRGWNYDPFTNAEFETAKAIISWVNACVQNMKNNKMLRIQKALNKFLLDATEIMFDDINNTNNLVDHVMLFTKQLMLADKCALFLVDRERNELYADLFDEGALSKKGTPLFTKKPQIRFPLHDGIEGYVAKTNKIVNIKDAYKDARFNPEIDKKTGYHTKNILCMPISGKQGVIGVVQMINKMEGGQFSRDDERAFEMCSVYYALAIHYCKVYSSLAHQRNLLTITNEVLDFHIIKSKQAADVLVADYVIPDDKIPASFDHFDFCAYGHDDILPKLFIRKVHNLFGESQFDIHKLCRFILTIEKNYRNVTYHNWEHAFHVAHSVWQMIKTCDTFTFSEHEKMALLFSAICHDIDHRGYNNDFYRKLELPLASLYSSSYLENHHFQQTINILKADGHDIFAFLTTDEYTVMIEMIRKNILATDLALYFGNQKFLVGLIGANEFNVDKAEHRAALFSLMMTGADICAVPKPWKTQAKTIEYLYDEFWVQGDTEKTKGFEPMAMMDRKTKAEIPNQQIGFINFICKPLYKTLSTLLPGTQPLLLGSENTEENWKRVLQERSQRKKSKK